MTYIVRKHTPSPCLLILLSAFLLLGQSCGWRFTPNATPSGDRIATAAAATLTALSINTEVAPIVTTSISSTDTPEEIPPSPTVESLTPTSTCTSTPEGVFISVSVDTRCRTGPGQDYEQVGALLVGETAEVIGRYPPANYYIIANPDGSGVCWLWGEYATLTGDVNQLPIITPAPLPTETRQGFTLYVRFFQMDNCNGIWVLAFEIASPDVGPQGMHSAAATVTEPIHSQIIGEMSSNSPFCLNPCGPCAPSSGGGAWTLIVVPIGPNPQISGVEYLLNLIVCTQDDLQGQCATQELRFRIPGG